MKDAQMPRVGYSNLKSFINRKVLFVGRVENVSPDGSLVTLTAPDGSRVTVQVRLSVCKRSSIGQDNCICALRCSRWRPAASMFAFRSTMLL